MTLVAPVVAERVEVVPDEPLVCAGLNHHRSLYGHVAEQEPSYMVRMPCGRVYPCCAGRVSEYVRVQRERPLGNASEVQCVGVGGCGCSHHIKDVTWTDLL